MVLYGRGCSLWFVGSIPELYKNRKLDEGVAAGKILAVTGYPYLQLNLSASERYEQLKHNYPNLYNRVGLGYIAHFRHYAAIIESHQGKSPLFNIT